jgi:hypothetical protein
MPWFGKKKTVVEEHKFTGRVRDLLDTQQECLDLLKTFLSEQGLDTDPRFDDYYLLRF